MAFMDSRQRDENFSSKMMNWTKRLFIGIGIMTVLSIVMFSVMLNRMATPEAPALPDKIVLTYTIKSGLLEKVSKPSLGQPLMPGPTLHDVTRMLADAAGDARVKGIVAKLDEIDMAPAQMQEMRDAIVRFRKTGKFALLFAADISGRGSMGGYYLASSFDQIWLQPVGQVSINGISTEIPFAKNLLDKIGVEPEFLHKGIYKSAPESLTETEMSQPHREMMISMITDLSDQVVTGIAQSRRIPVDQMRQLVNYSPYTDADALKLNLIDKIGYYDQLTDGAISLAGDGAKLVKLQSYADATEKQDGTISTLSRSIKKEKPDGSKPKIALIIGTGTITSAKKAQVAASSASMNADKIVAAFTAAEEDKDVKAVVFRIDSPGGSPTASESIRHAITKMQKAGKPVIVSMGGFAASGGYWVATPADKIIAQPASITGSIGVFGGKLVLAELWNKIGMKWQAVSAGDNARMWSPNAPFTAKERERFDAMLNNIYESFITRVMQGRKMTRDQVIAIAEGRVWTGRQAKDKGLVDDLGGLEKAILVAKETAKLGPDAPVENFPRKKSTLELLIEMAMEGISVSPSIHIDTQELVQQMQDTAVENNMLQMPQLQIQ